jgi:hypothetical protein
MGGITALHRVDELSKVFIHGWKTQCMLPVALVTMLLNQPSEFAGMVFAPSELVMTQAFTMALVGSQSRHLLA